jgi:hypothetical protein
MSLGPYLSFSLPSTILTSAAITYTKDTAPVSDALDQPNSETRGVINTPKLLNIPRPRAWRKKEEITIIYP